MTPFLPSQFFSDARESETYLRNLQDSIKRKYSCDHNTSLTRLEDLLQDSMVGSPTPHHPALLQQRCLGHLLLPQGELGSLFPLFGGMWFVLHLEQWRKSSLSELQAVVWCGWSWSLAFRGTT